MPSRSTVFRLGALLALGAVAGVALLLLPLREYLTRFLDWVEEAGPWGPILLGVSYVPAAVFFVRLHRPLADAVAAHAG